MHFLFRIATFKLKVESAIFALQNCRHERYTHKRQFSATEEKEIKNILQ